MTSFNSDRRKFLAGGSAALVTALAGCGAFADGRGVPGKSEPIEDDEENREAFREEYAAMSVFEKARENTLLAGGIVLMVLLTVGVIAVV
jgi:hypothetical protein